MTGTTLYLTIPKYPQQSQIGQEHLYAAVTQHPEAYIAASQTPRKVLLALVSLFKITSTLLPFPSELDTHAITTLTLCCRR